MSSPSVTYGPPWDLKNRRVAVLGWGRSGRAAARLALREGAQVEAFDEGAPSGSQPEIEGSSGLELVSVTRGKLEIEKLAGFDLIVLSPGVDPERSEFEIVKQRGVEFVGELELATSFFGDAPILAITGTNGKSTTTSLCGALIEADGRKVFVGGNLGRPASEAALLEEAPEIYVLELSSFQLQSTRHFHPRVAAILNLTPDHLDRHHDLEGYAAAKERICLSMGEEDVLVLNGDDSRVRGLAVASAATRRFFGYDMKIAGGQLASCCIEEGRVVYLAPDGVVERYKLDNQALRGPHNQANASAAVLMVRTIGISPSAVAEGLRRFPGLPHRLESVRTLRGVEWVNDSKATNVDSAVTAVSAFAQGIILIAGGRGKGASYAPLAEAGRGKLKAVIGVGEDGPAICQALEESAHRQVEIAETLEQAIHHAATLASSGDTVLLSPACASYDQFENYELRGALFRHLVEGLQ